MELDHEVVTLWAELDLKVSIVVSHQEELYDLVVPQACRRTGRHMGPGIVVPRGIDA
jgi:hypothetical protein